MLMFKHGHENGTKDSRQTESAGHMQALFLLPFNPVPLLSTRDE